MHPDTFLFASTNRGKLVEVRAIAALYGLHIRSLDEVTEKGSPPEVDESAPSYLGNARLKASAYFAWSGMPCIADDTGLEVAALGGRPGVHSARYAGPNAEAGANRAKLLGELSGVVDRRAAFRCVLCLKTASDEVVAEGSLKGTIAEAPSGVGGFGYDSVFVVEGEERTLAELKGVDVAVRTHRIEALHQLFRALGLDRR